MRKNYTIAILPNLKLISVSFLLMFFFLFIQQGKAQTSYKTATNLAVPKITSALVDAIHPQGSFSIKDGQLDEIYNLKFSFSDAQLKALSADRLIEGKKITFEQTRVMVLPLMGMVHVVGTLDIGGHKGTSDFQLAFKVNNDESVSFKGSRAIKLSDFVEGFPKNEVKLDFEFVLKNNTTELATLTP
ncbi:MAG: hypothetical protein EOO90_09555 [Pedobacter sp.]|nr:MAG: hypothetical protein EOO90_09555 [Pedobacter sp.]